jgi:gamma-glutamylaminecyclotransferase
MSQAKEYLIFVFGTLKQGFPNFSLNTGALVDADCKTRQPYPFYLVGERYSPWLINDPGKGSSVSGEVYRVTEQQIIGMDQLERTDQANGYRREMITVKTADQKMLKTFCYLKQPDQLQKAEIRLGPLSVYRHQHAAMYQSRL